MAMTETTNPRWKDAVLYLTRAALVPLVLLVLIGPRSELIGIAVGIGLLTFPIDRRRTGAVLLSIGAALAAVAAGFRIQFITNPAGGYVYFTHSSVVITFLWIIVVLGARAELERRLPHRPLQVLIDAFLVLNAILLVAISPQARIDHLAIALAVAAALSLIVDEFLPRRAGYTPEHAVIAFILAGVGISGVVKGAVSLSLLGPLAVLGVPVLITVRPHFASFAADAPLLRGGWPRRYSLYEFVAIVSILTTALSTAAIIAIYYPTGYAFIPAAVIPALYGWHRLRRVVTQYVATDVEPSMLLGVRFTSVTLNQAVERVRKLIGMRGSARIVVTPNPSALLVSRHDPALRAAYARADLVLADGIGVVWGLRALGRPVPGRVTGVDLAARLMAWANESGARVFLIGGRPGVAAQAAHRLRTRFHRINIVGTHHGYFITPGDVIPKIAATRPNIVLVGMGVPRQERFMLAAQSALSGAVLIGIGGTLDLFAGRIKRAPQRWQKCGLEWLYRTIHEPGRFGSLIAILRFITVVGAMWLVTAFADNATIRPPDRPLPLAPSHASRRIRGER